MKHRIVGLASLFRVSPTIRSFCLSTCAWKTPTSIQHKRKASQLRSFSIASRLRIAAPKPDDYNNSNARPAAELNNNITQEEKDHFAQKLQEDKGKQIRTPWHRQGSDVPPVARQRSAGAMTKGKLLTTPSRMLKIILPLTTLDTNTDRKDIEPLALLVHPQQPISYLERLIQSELPMITDKEGKKRIPNVYFRAADSMQADSQPSKPAETVVSDESEAMADQVGEEDFEKVDEIRVNGKTEKTGKLSVSAEDRKTPEEAAKLRRGVGQGGVESYSGQGQDATSDKVAERKFVRWSKSTEIGDFIRDAARGQEFAIEIEGAPEEIRVGVPSFDDRTYYLRMRLRKLSKGISEMADVKKECDRLAHVAAQRVATAGFMGIVSWWGVVYYLTFQTELGWDVMEPVTYLVGLSTLIGGYLWFLYHNREVSYKSAMNFTISRRQQKLYSQHNFDLHKWEVLIEDGNTLRKEIKAIANEYDVEWDESKDEHDVKVTEALRKDRKKKKEGKKGKDDDEDSSDEKEKKD